MPRARSPQRLRQARAGPLRARPRPARASSSSPPAARSRRSQAGGCRPRKVSEHTGAPEILGGRVKTLHPQIHGGILGRPRRWRSTGRRWRPAASSRSRPGGREPLPVPRRRSPRGAAEAEVIEQIDIGGPAMVRAAAKNSRHVAVVVDPADYEAVLAELREERRSREETRRAADAQGLRAHRGLRRGHRRAGCGSSAGEPFPDELSLSLREGRRSLRYGENPHQRGAFYRTHRARRSRRWPSPRCSRARSSRTTTCSTSTPRSACVLEFPEQPCAVIIKHNTPCGVALDADAGEGLPHGARGRRGLAPSAASSRSTARWTRRPRRRWPRPSSRRSSRPSYSPRPRAGARGEEEPAAARGRAGAGRARRRPRVQLEARSVSGGLLVQDRDAVEPAARVEGRHQARSPPPRSWRRCASPGGCAST